MSSLAPRAADQPPHRAAIRDTVQTIARAADLRQWYADRAAFADGVELGCGTAEARSPHDVVAHWRPLLPAFDATERAGRDVGIELGGDHAAWRAVSGPCTPLRRAARRGVDVRRRR